MPRQFGNPDVFTRQVLAGKDPQAAGTLLDRPHERAEFRFGFAAVRQVDRPSEIIGTESRESARLELGDAVVGVGAGECGPLDAFAAAGEKGSRRSVALSFGDNADQLDVVGAQHDRVIGGAHDRGMHAHGRHGEAKALPAAGTFSEVADHDHDVIETDNRFHGHGALHSLAWVLSSP